MRLNDGRIIPDFIYQALRGESVIIYGDETATGTFCYVDDLVDGLIKLMTTDVSGPINLGSEPVYRLKDVAEAIQKITLSSSKIVYQDPLPYRTPEPIPDITLAKEKLDWIPITQIEDGLIKTVQAMKASKIIKFNQYDNR